MEIKRIQLVHVTTDRGLCGALSKALHILGHLHTCPNCVHYDGVRCLLQRPEATDLYPGVQCPVFAFRENRVVLR